LTIIHIQVNVMRKL